MPSISKHAPAPAARPPASGWLGYLAVKNADEAVERIARAGGRIEQQPFEVMDAGRMAVFRDSEGARAAIWEPKRHAGAGIMREVGTICWNELVAKDAERARQFYSAAFGWKPELKSLGPAGDYTYWNVAGEPSSFGGMLQMTAEWGNQPAAWMTYFKVADCDETAAAAVDAGGTALYEPFDAPGVGRIAVLADPLGGKFSIIKFTMPGR